MQDINDHVAYAHWLAGDWNELLDLCAKHEANTSKIKQVNLLLLAASLQLMDGKQDREMAVIAVQEKIQRLKAFRINKEKLGAIFLSGAYNSLARAHCLNSRPAKAREYFHQALKTYNGLNPSSCILNMRAEVQIQQLEKNGIKVEKNKSLKQLYKEHNGHVSDKWSLYLDVYNDLFCKFRDKPISLLEIGVQNGGSLEIWAKFFPKYKNIIGCDINPKCASISYEEKNLHIVVGDATSEAIKNNIFDIQKEFDIVIDDGSHKSSDIVKAFFQYFPLIKEGGVFIAEDLHCSYWRRYEGGLGYQKSSIEFFKLLSDIINHEHWVEEKNRLDILHHFQMFDEKFEKILGDINSVEFFNSLCVVTRKKESENWLKKRVVAGAKQMVVDIKGVDGTYSSVIK